VRTDSLGQVLGRIMTVAITICILLRRQVTVGYWWAMIQLGRRVRALRELLTDRLNATLEPKHVPYDMSSKRSRQETACVPMSDTDTLLVSGLRGEECVNGTREAEGIICGAVMREREVRVD
jgi:hypothetical protein